MKHINIRVLSITNRILEKSSSLEKEHTERYEVIRTYIFQLIQLVLFFSDSILENLIKIRLRYSDGLKSAKILKEKVDSVK